MSIRPATLARIEEAHRFSAFYGGYLANHLPMALAALDAMGAGDGEMGRFASRYARQLEVLPPARFDIARGDERRHLGSPEAFSAWVAYFARRLDGEGREAVFAEWGGTLAGAIGTAAFHGAIRTAYSLESGSVREIAFALAYWAAAFGPPRPIAALNGSESPAAVLAAIAADPEHGGKRPQGRSIAARAGAAASQPSFAAYVARVDPAQLTGETVAGALIRAYAAGGDFTLLHGVTGCHAFRLLAPSLGEREAALRHLWHAVVAAFMSCGSPRPEGWGLEGDDSLDWPAIHRRAALCDDEHDVKFAYSCWREWQAYGDDLYRRAASARVSAAMAASPVGMTS
jgi:questin oxidase-like protein